jgi:tetratricopeptide (TPR) repeat protein
VCLNTNCSPRPIRGLMARQKTKNTLERAPRRRIPPPPPFWLYDQVKGFFGLSILHETDGSAGVALWRAARTARLFVDSGAKRRECFGTLSHAKLREIFSVEEVDPFAHQATIFEIFARARSRPQVTEPELASACSRVSEWAGGAWKKQTELHFAELAARVDPNDPSLANAAARLCREASLFDRAALWFERGYRFAARSGDRSEAVSSLLGYGALMKECGRLDEARRWFLKAARRAARTGRRRSAAETRHDLMALAAEAGDVSEVIEHAEAAVELYPLHHRRLPYLAHDFAYALIRTQQYALAYPLLELFVRVVPKHHLLPDVATFAWAAAGRGLVHRYDDAERRALAQISVDQQQAAPSLIFLAEGARVLGRWSRAERHAREAIDSAVRMNQSRYEQDARALLADVLEQRPITRADGEMVEVYPLTRHFEIRLRRWKPGREVGGGTSQNRASGSRA